MRWAAVGAAGLGAVDRYLLPHERQVTATRQHPAILVGPGVLAVAGLLAAAILSATVLHGRSDLVVVVWTAWLVLLLRVIWQAANWTANFFVVTSDRILMATGVLGIKVSIIPLWTVNDIRLARSLGGRLFGYGNLLVESGAPDQILQKIDYIPHAEEFFLEIAKMIFPAARAPCPLCHGAGRVFQRPPGQAGAPETSVSRLDDEPGQTGDDLLAQGYLEIVCPECGGRGAVAAGQS